MTLGAQPPVRALLLDFDGTMVETESASYAAWRETLAGHGYDLTVPAWIGAVGTLNGVDPVALLQAHTGVAIDGDDLRARARARHHELVATEQLRDGVQLLVDDARDAGLHTAIVTAASSWWVRTHLTRLGIDEHWEHVIAADGDITRAKPSPVLYHEAASLLQIDPAQAVVVEDSLNGIRAAKAAGMTCVAFPNPITATLDLSEADLVVDDLGGLGLGELLRRIGRATEPG